MQLAREAQTSLSCITALSPFVAAIKESNDEPAAALLLLMLQLQEPRDLVNMRQARACVQLLKNAEPACQTVCWSAVQQVNSQVQGWQGRRVRRTL